MKKILLFILSFLVFINLASAQSVKGQSGTEKSPDSTALYPLSDTLGTIIVIPKLYFSKASDWYRYNVLRRKVLKVYPFAKMAGDNLKKIDERLEKLPPERRRYYRRGIENYIRKVIEPQLKELTVTEGRVLVRLIYRQTGMSIYQLLKKYKSGLSAFWWQRIAKLYDINLKEEYHPESRKEDFWIEDILRRAFTDEILEESPPAFEIKYLALYNKYMERIPKNYFKLRAKYFNRNLPKQKSNEHQN